MFLILQNRKCFVGWKAGNRTERNFYIKEYAKEDGRKKSNNKIEKQNR